MYLFSDQEIMNGIDRYYLTGKIPSRSWFMAINVILAHSLRGRNGTENDLQREKYIANAMSMFPSSIMMEPNALVAGAMLSMVNDYRVEQVRYSTALTAADHLLYFCPSESDCYYDSWCCDTVDDSWWVSHQTKTARPNRLGKTY